MKKFIPFFFLIIFIFSFSGIVWSQTDTLVLQPGPADGIDVTIQDINPASNFEYDDDFHANAWTAQGISFIDRGLIEFDLTSIPLNATVISAILTLHTNLNSINYQLNYGDNAAWLIRVIAPWQVDQVTWNTQPETADTGFISLPQNTVNDTIGYNVNVTTDVQNMVRDPCENFGWIIKLQTEVIYTARNFASSDNAVPEWRPRLTVVYSHCLPPQAEFSFIVNQYSVQFTDQSQPADSWNWQFGDGGTSNLQNPEYTYTSPGKYVVRLTIHDSCGSNTHTDTVHVLCNAPVAGYYYDFLYPYFQFYDTTRSTTLFAWSWDFGDGMNSTDQNPIHEYVNPGTYTVCLKVTDSCSTDSVCKEVSFFLPIHVTFSSEQVVENGLEVAFTDKTEGAKEWFWSFGDGCTSILRNPVHVYKQGGGYKVCLKAGNGSSYATSCDSIHLQISAGVISYTTTVYPNPPITKEIRIRFETDSDYADIGLYDFLGKLIDRQKIAPINKTIPNTLVLPEMESGLYFLKVQFNGIDKVFKVLIP